MVNDGIDVAPFHINRSDRPEADIEQCVEWSAVAIDHVGQTLFVRRISTTSGSRKDKLRKSSGDMHLLNKN